MDLFVAAGEKKENRWNREGRRLSRFLLADQGHFDVLAAVRTGQIDVEGLLHDSLRHIGKNGIDVVQPFIQQLDLQFQPFYIVSLIA
jgi:hypothetical protein